MRCVDCYVGGENVLERGGSPIAACALQSTLAIMNACRRLTKAWGAGVATTMLIASCSGNANEGDAARAAHAFGWSHPVAAYNTILPVDIRMGSATDTIEGHTLEAIVTDATVRVRGDDHACVDCHSWAKTMDRVTFCTTHVAELEALPTATGNGDPPNAKPLVLKELLADWKARGCPD